MTNQMSSWKRLLGEGFRFGLVGIAATIVYVIASLLASSFEAGPYLSNLVGYLASVAVSYFGHAYVTFRSTQSHILQGSKFLLASSATFVLTNLIVFFAVDLLGRSFTEAAITVAIAIPLLTWLIARYWVFRER